MLLSRPRADAFLERYDLGAIVATSPANVTFLSDFPIWLAYEQTWMFLPGASPERSVPLYAVYPREGEPVLLVASQLVANADDIWVEDVRPVVAATVPEALSQLARERGFDSGRIAFELEPLGALERATVAEALPGAELLECTNLLRLLRMVKSDEARERIRKATDLTERALLAALADARPGVTMPHLRNRFELLVVEAGGMPFGKFAFVARGRGFATEPAYELLADDVFEVDVGGRYQYCTTDVGTTLVMPDAPAAFVDQHEALVACVRAGAAVARPGLPCSAVYSAMATALHEHGLSHLKPWGHGLGLDGHEYPTINPPGVARIRDGCVDEPSDIPLEEGMTINLECNLIEPGVGSLDVEELYLITAAGCEPLVPRDRSQPVRPGR